jgi:hypothetical protein
MNMVDVVFASGDGSVCGLCSAFLIARPFERITRSGSGVHANYVTTNSGS